MPTETPRTHDPEATAPGPRSVRNLRIAGELFSFAYQVKSHQYRLMHVEATDQEIHRLTMAAIERGCK